MILREMISTQLAPAPIGNYSQAVKIGNMLYLSGQIPLQPETMELVKGDIQQQVDQVFENINKVLEAAHSNMNEIVKLTVFLTDLASISAVNNAIARYFNSPYPARTSIQVAALPKNACVEIEALAITSI